MANFGIHKCVVRTDPCQYVQAEPALEIAVVHPLLRITGPPWNMSSVNCHCHRTHTPSDLKRLKRLMQFVGGGWKA
eukprot:3250348-Rhodomonas_salina.1